MSNALSVRFDWVVAVRWLARGLAAALVLFWGMFFVEHLAWFAEPAKVPLGVWGMQALHLAMLVGLVVGWRWELAGALLVAASSIPFFWFAAGKNFIWFSLVTLAPAALWLVLVQWDRPAGRVSQQAGGA